MSKAPDIALFENFISAIEEKRAELKKAKQFDVRELKTQRAALLAEKERHAIAAATAEIGAERIRELIEG